jgi:beta-mannanase
MIAWEPWLPGAGVEQAAYRLAHIARGDFDAYVNSWAYRLAAYDGPVLLRFAHEMNAPWYPWGIGVNGNDAAAYVAAWRRLHARFAEAGAGNVRWVWCVDAASLDERPAAPAYPGDDVVDWLAFDAYNWGDTLPDTRWLPLPEAFGPAYDAVAALGAKPIMVAETGCAEAGGSKAAWIADGFPTIPTVFPRIAALCWFNEKRPTADWRIESSTIAAEAFAAVVADSSWQARLGADGMPVTTGG